VNVTDASGSFPDLVLWVDDSLLRRWSKEGPPRVPDDGTLYGYPIVVEGREDREGEEMSDEVVKKVPFRYEGAALSRNQACPCGSGEKFKRCHGLEGYARWVTAENPLSRSPQPSDGPPSFTTVEAA
jgi:hypothetical protein